MLRTKFILIMLLCMALAMLFVSVNPESVAVELLFARWQVRSGLVLVIAFALGVIIGGLMRGFWVAELLSERGRLRRALKLAEAKARSYAGREVISPDTPASDQ